MAFQAIKPRTEPFSAYGYNGISVFDDSRSTSEISSYIYQLTFSGIGKIKTVRQRYEIIMGSPLIQQKTNSKEVVYKIHPFFYYLMEKLMRFETLSMLKFTEYNPRVLQQFIKSEDKQKAGANNEIHQAVYTLINELSTKIQAQKEQNDRTQKLQQFTRQMQKAEDACWASYNTLVAKGFVQPYLKNFKLQQEKPQIKQQAVKKLFQQVKAIEPIRKNYQQTKLMLFQKRHKSFYYTSLVPNGIRIKRLGNHPELMHSLEEHVRLREPDSKMNENCVTIITSLCQELKNYTNVTSNENVKFFYQFLEPSTIFMDQLALRPKLSFNPVLLDAMGLKKKPVSLQNHLTFFPTPQGFNYFQSLTELQIKNKLILDDAFYGCIQMLGQQKNRLPTEHKKQIYGTERMNLQQIKQKMMVWRFILTCYYLTRGRQFGRQLSNGQCLQKTQENFKKMLQAKQVQFKDIKKVIQFMFGPALPIFKRKKKENADSEEFKFNFEQLYSQLGLKQSEVQLIQDLKFKRIKKYHNLRKHLMRQILKVFMAQNIFGRLFNVKKYMIMYSIIANQVLEEAKQLLDVEKRKARERKNLKESLDKDIRRLRSQKTYKQTLASTLQKIQKYLNRTDSDAQTKYIQRETDGVQCYNSVLQISNFISQMQIRQEKLNQYQSAIKNDDQIQNERERQINDKNIQKHKQRFVQICRSLDSNFKQLRYKCRRIFQKCYKYRLPEDLHKYDRKSEDSRENHRLYTKEFQLIVKSLYLLNVSNYPIYQSLIVNHLNLDQSERRPQVPNLSKQKRMVKQQTLKLIDELLEEYEDPNFKEFQPQSQPNFFNDHNGPQINLFFPHQKEGNLRKTSLDPNQFQKQTIIWKVDE